MRGFIYISIMLFSVIPVEAYTQDSDSIYSGYKRFFTLTYEEFPNADTDRIFNERAVSARNLGLTFYSDYTRRYGEGFVDFTQEQDRSNAYFRSGVRWDILRNGFFQNKRQTQILEADLELNELNHIQAKFERAYYFQFATLAYLFEIEKLQIVGDRLSWFKNHQKQVDYLYASKYIMKNEYEANSYRKEELSQLQDQLEQSVQAYQLVFSKDLGVLNLRKLTKHNGYDIDIVKLLDSIDSYSYLFKKAELRRDQILLRNHWNSRFRFYASFDYTYQFGFSRLDRDYTTFRLRFEMPINFNQKYRSSAMKAEMRSIEQDLNFELDNRKKELLTLYKEYTYKQKQINEARNKIAAFKEVERVKNIMANSVDTYSAEHATLFIEDDIKANLQEIVDLRHLANKILLKMNLLLPEADIYNYMIIDEEVDKVRPSILLAANEYIRDKSFLINFAELQNVQCLFIPFSILDDWKPWINQLNDKSVDVYLLLDHQSLDSVSIESEVLHQNWLKSWGIVGIARINSLGRITTEDEEWSPTSFADERAFQEGFVVNNVSEWIKYEYSFLGGIE